MVILTVLPIARGILSGRLSYFAKDPAPVGSVIMVPLRSREIPALVLEVADIVDAKTALKSSDFAVRKIARPRPRLLWAPAFVRAAEQTARYFAQGLGETLLALTPKTILDAGLSGKLATPDMPLGGKTELLAIQENTALRLESYARLIRESFVHGESLFICLPSSEDVERVAQALSHGIEDYVIPFHHALTKKRVLEHWQKALTEKHAIVVVGTAQYLTLPRFFKTIVLDEEHARTWNTIARPHLDLRIFAEHYAHEAGSRLIFGAPILRPETHARLKTGEIHEWNRVALHARAPVETALIDPRIEEKNIKEATGRRTLQIISEPIRALIATASKKNESILLLVARKGLAPITVCGDCGTAVRCPACETPLVIHKREGDKRVFTCHSCGFMRAPEDGEYETCPACKSWRLEGLGIGTERVEEEALLLSPDTPRFVFDGDHVKTPAQARKLIAQFEKAKAEGKAGAVLIATPMVLPYLSTTDHTAVVSIDSLFAIPDFRMHERIFALILALREKTAQKLLVQTRTDDTTLLQSALEGNLGDFTENERALREAFSYPPYGTIIKVSVRGKRETVAKEIEDLKTYLSEYEPISPNTMSREPRNMFRMHLILKLALGAYPNDTLIAKLRALPPHMAVEVNPDHLL